MTAYGRQAGPTFTTGEGRYRKGGFPAFLAGAMNRKRNTWSDIGARRLGRIVDLCLKSDGLDIQVCNATNDTITACEPIAGFLARYCPGTPVTPALREFEAPPSSREIREVPGFREQHDWCRYVPKSHGRMQRGTEAR